MEWHNSVLGFIAQAASAAWEWFVSFDPATGVLGLVMSFFVIYMIVRFVLGPIFGFTSLSDTAIKGMKKMSVGSTSSPTPRSSTQFAGGKIAKE